MAEAPALRPNSAQLRPFATRVAELRATLHGPVTGDQLRSRFPDLFDGALPAGAGDQTRAVLDLYADPKAQLDPDAQDLLQNLLQTHGYAIGAAGQGDATALRQTNVTEPDVLFNHLLERSGAKAQPLTVGILDAGFDPRDVVFQDKLVAAQAVGPEPLDSEPEHGTIVGGEALAGTPLLRGALIKIPLGQATLDIFLEALRDAVGQGARVINMSFGGMTVPAPVKQAFEAELRAHPQVVFLKSAGNAGGELGGPEYPAATTFDALQAPNLITVAATAADGTLSASSNYGADYVHIAMPGDYFPCALPGNVFEGESGTSINDGRASNLAGKLLLLDPGLTPAGIRSLLIKTSDPSKALVGKIAAGGVVNRERALRLAALTGLIRRGSPPEAAAGRLGLSDLERQQVLPLANALTAPA